MRGTAVRQVPFPSPPVILFWIDGGTIDRPAWQILPSPWQTHELVKFPKPIVGDGALLAIIVECKTELFFLHL